MKKNPERTVAALVGLSLIILMSVQVIWAIRSYNLAENSFNEKIVAVLNDVRDEANDAATCFTMYSKTYLDSTDGIFVMKGKWTGDEKDERWLSDHSPDSLPMFFNVPDEYKNSPFNRVYNDLKFTNPATAEIMIKFRYDLNHSSPEKNILNQEISTENFKELFKNHENLFAIYDTAMIDSLITLQLNNNRLPAEYSYALVKTPNDSVAFTSNAAETNKILTEGVRTRLTPADLFSYPYDIVLFPHNKSQLIIRTIIWTLALSLGVIVLLIFGFFYFTRTISRQKKLSAMKNDFINNITHELNTPIANISLAYETLHQKGKIVEDESSKRILEIVSCETTRLQDNVARILKISSIEQNGISLKREEVNLNELIREAVNRHELFIQKKNAEVKVEANKENVNFSGDRSHLLNAFENLVDNALKYSNGNCRIDVNIERNGKGTEIHVKDNGIGMTSNELEKIFDKFYRVQHGNIQNNRGFGLGLNYVKYVIEAHGGNISVESSPGEGSCFHILLNDYVEEN